MKIQYLTGNLIEADETIILHGVNAQGVMRSGVAKDIREYFPQAYTAYMKEHQARGLRMGSVIWAESADKVVGNCVTQEFYGREPNHRYCSYDAIARAMEVVNEMADDAGVDRVAMPLIGAGLAQGSWRIISAIIETHARSFTPVVYLLDGKVPES